MKFNKVFIVLIYSISMDLEFLNKFSKKNQKIAFGTKTDLRSVFGTLKTKKSAQELKDFAREGWF